MTATMTMADKPIIFPLCMYQLQCMPFAKESIIPVIIVLIFIDVL